MPRVIQVIEHQDIRGKGTLEDPVRVVMQYLDFSGNVLAEQQDKEYLVPGAEGCDVVKAVKDELRRQAPIIVTTDYRGSPCS